MKMTIVIDTDDVSGLNDAHKIVSLMRDKYAPAFRYGSKISFTKVEFIKMLRTFAKDSVCAANAGEDPAGLRRCKLYADDVFAVKT
jgi:hypothetical protein